MFIGDNKIGRNELCYCGSYKKYKDCHLNVDTGFFPKESFTTNVTGIENINAINNALPYIEVARVDISYRHPLPWDDELHKILLPLTAEKWNSDDRWEKLIENRKNKLAHELIILRHHIESFNYLERVEESEYKKGIIGNTTMNKIYENPLLISNTEAFLFQSKSTLDVFAQLIAHSFKFTISSYGNGGQKLLDILEGPNCIKYKADIEELTPLIRNAKSWVIKLKGMRDEVTHYSDLSGLACFMFKQINPKDTQVVIYYPSLSDGERVSKYMEFIWNNLVALIHSCLPILVRVVKNRRAN